MGGGVKYMRKCKIARRRDAREEQKFHLCACASPTPQSTAEIRLLAV